MPSTFGVVILALWGLLFATIIILTFGFCRDKDLTEHRRHPQDIETGESNYPVLDAMQRELPENQRASIPILPAGTIVIYKNQETESNCNGCAICLEEFNEGGHFKVLSNCKHLYHQLCIDQCLVRDRHCPLCRGSVHGLDLEPTTNIVDGS